MMGVSQVVFCLEDIRKNDSRAIVRWRRDVDAERDAGMVFQAASVSRPSELTKRLRLGKLAGGHAR